MELLHKVAVPKALRNWKLAPKMCEVKADSKLVVNRNCRFHCKINWWKLFVNLKSTWWKRQLQIRLSNLPRCRSIKQPKPTCQTARMAFKVLNLEDQPSIKTLSIFKPIKEVGTLAKTLKLLSKPKAQSYSLRIRTKSKTSTIRWTVDLME